MQDHFAGSRPQPSACRAQSRKRSGFALVISLSLMALILILLITIAGWLRIETLHQTTVSQKTDARQVALFAAIEALGELQQTTGADQRVTASASILDTSTDTEAITGVTEPYWTGVWITNPHDPNHGTGGDPHQNPAPIKNGLGNPGGALAWLVSSPNANPSNHTRQPSDIPLLEIDKANPADPRNIYLPLEDLRNTGGDIEANYAWWVADEGIKASVAMDNPHARSNLPQNAALSSLSAPRMAPEFIEDSNPQENLTVLNSLGSIFENDSYTALLARITRLNQLRYPLEGVGLSNGNINGLLANHYHDLTPLSLGVLSDAREGGLKGNLSGAFSDDTEFGVLLAEHGQLVFGHRNQAQPYDPADSDAARGNSATQVERRDPGGPPWEQLRSFYRMRANSLNVQPQTNSLMGVYPVITMVQLHTHMMLLETTASTPSNPEYTARLMVFPAIMLWNPYNVDLPQTTYSLILTSSANKLKYNWTPEVDWTDTSGNTHTWEPKYSSSSQPVVFDGGDEGGKDHGAIRLNITSSFAAGEAKLFLPPGVEEQDWSSASGIGNTLADASSPAFIQGGYFYSDLSENFRPTDSGNVPDLSKNFTLRLARDLGNSSNTSSLNNLVILMGVNLGNNTLQNLIQNHPLQSVGGFNHGALSNSSTTSNPFPAWSVSPSNILAEATASSTTWNSLPAASLGGDNYFPIVGFTQNLRWTENFHPVTYNSNLEPIVSTLASFNPRAVRSERTPIEHAQQPGRDTRYNPLYLNWSGNRSDNMSSYRWAEPGSSSTDWGSFYQSLLYTQPAVGYTNDPNISLITQDTLFDIPSGPEYFQSVGSLTHASTAPPSPRTDSITNFFNDSLASSDSDWNVNSSYPAFAIGNSLAPLGVPLDDRSRHTYLTRSNLPTDPQSSLYDWSYLLNDYLWDRYFFAEYDSANSIILNPRLIASENATPSEIQSYKEAAKVLMIRGAFNVNSTSIDAWRSLLGGTVGATINSTPYDDRAPYLKHASPLLGEADTSDEQAAPTYAGYRTLSSLEIEDLATEIVEQVKKRGPFISLSHFVNRVIDDPAFLSSHENARLNLSPTERERAIGALQAALEASSINQRYEQPDNYIDYNELNRFNQFNRYTGMGSLSYGQPGFMTQADLLSRVGAALSVRSDTFKIRSYGQSVDPITNESVARARCEMVVQRQPQEIRPGSNERPYKVVSFRWLEDHEI
ncbi:hypothetical protein [Puniceicoccus vermicola]|uniref:Verru_Chthon cassette protein A n=1 Tax=Puniceicoccus vermicola TaxID=388746 RepID=A0A7X1AXE6_9BACT|nr:hypothetical protein [Puniceicoccus vermicola]MBC2601793.1 hypothetical protein [Puniceicoccus vermicola]